MSVFGQYSRYYDLLYRDKDYQGEADFVAGILKRFTSDGTSILELGCGTGKHAKLLADKGYKLHGIDQSPEMLDAARARNPDVSFSQGDVRTLKLEKQFNAVISLFHVVSYQTSNDDLLAMFKTAYSHVKPGGIFFFDYWYGPAVLHDRPENRTKHMESDEIDVVRKAAPVMHSEHSVVDVNYHVTIVDKKTGHTNELHETHAMRYLFLNEIDLVARMSGFTVKESFEWMSGAAPSDSAWNMCSVLIK